MTKLDGASIVIFKFTNPFNGDSFLKYPPFKTKVSPLPLDNPEKTNVFSFLVILPLESSLSEIGRISCLTGGSSELLDGVTLDDEGIFPEVIDVVFFSPEECEQENNKKATGIKKVNLLTFILINILLLFF